jgi:hypothetical protein
MRSDLVNKIEKMEGGKKRTLEIFYDSDPMNPHDGDDIFKFAWAHKRYSFPNDSGLSVHNYSGWREYGDALPAKFKAIVYMIDHSWLGFRVNANFNDVDPGQWDSGIVGWIYMGPQEAKENGYDEEKFLTAVKAIVEEYEAYANGQVFYAVESLDDEPGETCGGFYSFKDMVDIFPALKAELEAL